MTFPIGLAAARTRAAIGGLVVALGLGVTAARVAAAPADLLVEKVLAAYGGSAALAKVASYRMEGTVAATMSGQGALVRTFSRPDRLKIGIDYPGRREVRLLDGGRGWRTDGGGRLVPVDGFLLASMVLQAARADLPWLLGERRAELTLLAPIDGGKVQELALPLGEGLTLTAYVSTATGRIVRSVGTLDVPGMSTTFVADYADFRTVDGVLFPFREANFASGRATGQTVITRVVVNPPLSDADFRP